MKLTIDFDEREAGVLMGMAVDKELPPQRVIINALHVYQMIDRKMAEDPEWMQKSGLLGPRMDKMAPMPEDVFKILD
jgi:hypothetical protein